MTSLLLLLALNGWSDQGTEESWREKQQRLLDLLHVEDAWEMTRGDPDFLIGIIDNGYDFFHPDLQGQLIPGMYYDGSYQTEFYESIAHGTMVASLMVASGRDPGRMIGLSPACRVLTASQGSIEHTVLKLRTQLLRENPNLNQVELMQKVAEHGDEIHEFSRRWVDFQLRGAADAIRYLVERGCRVINISAALEKSLCPDPEVWDVLQNAFDHALEHDVVIAIGAGNNSVQWEGYPQGEHVIVVGASQLDDTRWATSVDIGGGHSIPQGSNYGSRLTVMAPSQDIVVCVPHEERVYQTNDGPFGATHVPFEGDVSVREAGATSCATPIVASLAALIRCARPDLDALAVIDCIKKGCVDIGEPGVDELTGFGRVDFARSLELALER